MAKPAEQSEGWQQWAGPVGLGLTFFMLSYTVGVVQPIMPPMVRGFDSTVGYVQSALVLMSLVTASFTPTAENLSRRLGRKPVFAAALACFALGLGVIVVSPTMGLFTLGLAGLTGMAAAVLVSTPVALMEAIFPDPVANKYALVALAIAGVLGSLVGSITGGLMAFELSWRWAFGLELAFIPLVWVLVRQIAVSPPDQPMAVDWLGGLLSVAGFGLTLVGLSLAADLGWWAPRNEAGAIDLLVLPFKISVAPVMVATGMICLGLLIFWQRQRQRRGEVSLLRLGVFSRRIYTLGLAIASLQTLLSVGIQFNLFQFIPAVVGLNPLRTALVVMPMTITQLIVLIGLVKRKPQFPPRSLLQGGIVVKAIGLAMLIPAVSPPVTPLGLLPALVVLGLGTGLFGTYITSLTFADTSSADKAEARGVYRPIQTLGASLGRGILGTVLVSTASARIIYSILDELGESVSPEVSYRAIRTLQVSLQTLRRSEQRELFAQLPAAIQPSLSTILQTAATEAMQITLGLALALCLLCLGMSFWLPKTVKTLEAPIE